MTIAAATPADVPRLHELAARTRQFNSAGAGHGTEDWFRRMLAARDRYVVTVRLRDAFGDDGMVGGCVIVQAAEGAGDAAGAGDTADLRDAAGAETWTVPLLMMSCRAMGRGVIDALLAWLVRQAARSGAGGLRIPCVANGHNVPLRLALAAAGFRTPETRSRLPAGSGHPPARPAALGQRTGRAGRERRVTPPAAAGVAVGRR